MLPARSLFAILYLFALSFPATSIETATAINSEDPSQLLDTRQLATMPIEVQQFMTKNMRDHLAALNEIITYLAAGDLDNAATIAETRLGTSSMGHHPAGIMPGRYMPAEMRMAGWAMHEAASEFALIAKQGDLSQSYQALQKITAACVACHYSFRIR